MNLNLLFVCIVQDEKKKKPKHSLCWFLFLCRNRFLWYSLLDFPRHPAEVLMFELHQEYWAWNLNITSGDSWWSHRVRDNRGHEGNPYHTPGRAEAPAWRTAAWGPGRHRTVGTFGGSAASTRSTFGTISEVVHIIRVANFRGPSPGLCYQLRQEGCW